MIRFCYVVSVNGRPAVATNDLSTIEPLLIDWDDRGLKLTVVKTEPGIQSYVDWKKELEELTPPFMRGETDGH